MKRCVMLLILLVALLPAYGWARSSNVTISGTVADQTGAVVPAAEVTVNGEGAAAIGEAITGSDGSYPGFPIYTLANEPLDVGHHL
jgi:type 1 fimbria pilin